MDDILSFILSCSCVVGRCSCPANFYGQRCTETHDDCSMSSNEALCGHGTCQNIARTLPGLVSAAKALKSSCVLPKRESKREIAK